MSFLRRKADYFAENKPERKTEKTPDLPWFLRNNRKVELMSGTVLRSRMCRKVIKGEG